jgi:thioredoxin-dependent peroxiredoxin
MSLRVGDIAPDFETTDCKGNPVKLSALRGRRTIVFFFPKSFTIGCVAENRAFRDNHERIRSLGAELVGISVDNLASQCAFAEAEDLRFTLIADENREISKRYDVLWPVLNIDRRVTFIISPDGVIEHIIKHEVRVSRHLDDVLNHLQA